MLYLLRNNSPPVDLEGHTLFRLSRRRDWRRASHMCATSLITHAAHTTYGSQVIM